MKYNKRNISSTLHGKKANYTGVRTGNPTKYSVKEGEVQTWNIPRKGLHDVVNIGGNLYYSKWITLDDDTYYWDDVRLSLASVRLPASNYPTWTAYKNTQVLAFDTGEKVHFEAQLPHGYLEGSDIEFHVHYALPTAGSGGGAENLRWQLEYTWTNIGSAIGTVTTVDSEEDVQTYDADTHYLFEVSDIGGGGKTISSVLLCTLTRISATANDYAHDAYFLSADFHIKINTLGSVSELSK